MGLYIQYNKYYVTDFVVFKLQDQALIRRQPIV